MARRVTAIRKPNGAENSYEYITDITYIEDGTSFINQQTLAQVISAIDNGVSYYVSRGGKSIPITTTSKKGLRYIKSEPDSTKVDNLLFLPTF